jgi:hypothetical protein
MQSQRGAWISENWTEDHAQVLRLAASDPRVERIFVATGIKVWLCRNETGQPRLSQPDPSRERTSLPFPRAARLSCRVAQL